jgi:predicted permease
MNWFLNAMRGRGMERAVAEDIENHLAEKTAALIEAGTPEREARLQARRELGNAALLIEASREVWGWMWLERLVQDLRLSTRLMARNPGFTAVAILSLALGIGANAAIFGLLDRIAWRMLPVHNPEELRIVEVVRTRKSGTTKTDTSYTYAQYALWRDHARSFQALAGYSAGLRWRDRSSAVGGAWHDGQFVSGNYFDVLGVPAVVGRVLTPADDSIDGAGGPDGAVALVSYRYWQTTLHAEPSAIGRPVNVNGAWLTIVGVTPRDFFGSQVGRAPDLFVPMHLQPAVLPVPGSLLHDPPNGGTTWVSIVGRLQPGVTETQAKTDLTSIYEGYEVSRMNAADRAAYFARQRPLPGVVVLASGSRGLSQLRDRFSQPLKALMALVAIVLLIACANLANLLLARGNARTKEIAVRLAIGAPRGRIVRQFLTESAILAIAGGAVGLLFALWSSRALLRMMPQNQAPLGLEIVPDLRLLAFTFAVSAASALLFGLAPALRATSHSASEAIKQIGETGAKLRRFALPKGLVVLEVALAVPLLAGAGLFIGTLRNLSAVDAGFLPQNVLQARISVDRAVLPKEQWRRVYDQLIDRAKAIPGTLAVSIVNHGLITEDATSSGPVHFPGYRFQDGESRNLLETYVGPEYFRATGIPLRLGRSFTAQDAGRKVQVAIVNETLVAQYLEGRNPIGLRFGLGDDADNIEIVGVVADAKYFSLRQDPLPMAYYPWQQVMPARMDTLLVRTHGDARAAEASLSKVVAGVHPDLLVDVRTLSSQVDDSIASERMLAQISAFLGGLALVLVCIGLYGIMAYAVTRRTREIGIRIALGALRGNVVWMMLGETLTLSVVGVIAGLPLAYSLTRIVGSFLYGLTPNNPIVLGGALLVLLGVSLLAAYFPARRASRLDALAALRYD